MRFRRDPLWSAAHAGLASAFLLLAPSAFAQALEEDLEKIIVTGSCIARPDGLTLSAGVETPADEQPLLAASQILANTDPSQYDVLRRRYYFNLTFRF